MSTWSAVYPSQLDKAIKQRIMVQYILAHTIYTQVAGSSFMGSLGKDIVRQGTRFSV